MRAPAGTEKLAPIDLIALAAAALMAGVIIGGADNGATTNDFRSFYLTSRAWRLGLPHPDLLRPDLKPPTFTLLFSPLTFFSERVARGVWTTLSLAAWVDALRRIRAATGLGPRGLLWLVCGCVAAMPAAVAWQLGQISWILLWIVTRAWISSAASRTRAGVWLGLAISIQPPLALMALLLPLGVCLAAAVTAGAMTGIGVLIAGIGAWKDWIALSGHVTWLPFPLNASLWGLAARVQSGGVNALAFSQMSWVWLALVVIVGLALALLTIRATGSRRWILAGLWSVLLSPLGWTHYLPTLIGPGIATSSSRRGALVTGLVLLAVPLPIVAVVAGTNAIATIALGSLYTAGLCCLWWAWAR